MAAFSSMKRRAISRKFSICGPNTIGFRWRAASRILWPPFATSEPPTNTAVERFAKGNSVVFEISKDGHLLRICSDGFDPLPVCLGLHSHDRVVFEHAAQPTAHQPVSRERFVGYSAIDHHHADSADSAFAKKIRPDFRLSNDDDLWAKPI